MSQVRHRVTALVFSGLLVGAPLLVGGTANAAQVEGHATAAVVTMQRPGSPSPLERRAIGVAPAVPSSEAAAEPVGSRRAPPQSIGLLALTAMVCVIGVSVGTIRHLCRNAQLGL